MADCTQLCPGAAQQPGSPSSSSTAVVDVELLARENPGLVLAQESNHSCSADAQHIAEVWHCMLLSLVFTLQSPSPQVSCGHSQHDHFLCLLFAAQLESRLTECPLVQAMQRAGLCGPHSPTRLLVLNPCTLNDALQSILEV